MENKLKKLLGLRKKDIRRIKKSGNFTLLELLIVVAIMAIIGGALIAAYDGLESQAARGVATRDIAAVDQAIRTFKVTEGQLPNNFETLLSAAPTTASANLYNAELVDNIEKSGITDVAQASFLPKIKGKFTVTSLSSTEVANLAAAGITTFRYLDSNADDDDLDTVPTIRAVGNGAFTDEAGGDEMGAISEISIPQHAYETPRGLGKNRGRGFAFDLSDLPAVVEAAGQTAYNTSIGSAVDPLNPTAAEITTADAARTAAEIAEYDTFNVKLGIWNAGTDGYNNIKVGANKDAKLVLLGVGKSSTLVGDGAYTNLAHAPFYGDTLKNQYSHYVALVDVTQSPAKFIAVVDARGDFLDEEFAEATGQKR
ncbi:MAG: type II secretion system GspH family protein [Lentisphaerales bacterium]|nr:type II secretion system GspH family protein [Lentisphaerales bacterium]